MSTAATLDAERLTQRDVCSIREGIRDFYLWVFLTLCRGGDWWDFRSRSVLPTAGAAAVSQVLNLL